MAKFNSKRESIKPTEVNCMGEMAYKLEDKETLVQSVLTTTLSGQYYETADEEVNKILDCVDKVDPLFVAKLALYARNEGNMRSSSHLLGAALAKYVTGQPYAARFYNKLIVRPDDMSEILSCYGSLNGMNLSNKSLRKIPNSLKKGFKAALERLDAYQIDKYKMNGRQVKLIDLVNLLHPTPTQKNEEAYKRLMNGESLTGLYQSRILEKEMSKTGQTSKTEKELAEAKADAISSVLDNVKGMPIFNLLRNLRNIILYAPNRIDDAISQLTTRDKIINSRLLPFRFATAYSEIEKMKYENNEETSSPITFESEVSSMKVSSEEFYKIKNKVLNALEDALEYACENIPELDGNVAILCDDSGSMRDRNVLGSSSRVSAFSNTVTSTIGHLFAAMLGWKQKDIYIGLFGDKLVPVKIDRSKRMLDFTKYLDNEGGKCGLYTEAGIYSFFRYCIEKKKKIDNIIVFSDCQIGSGAETEWYGFSSKDRSHGFQELFKEFKKINPICNFVVCNLRNANGNSVFHKSQRIINIAGWSEKIFEVIKYNTVGMDTIIKKIEAIEI